MTVKAEAVNLPAFLPQPPATEFMTTNSLPYGKHLQANYSDSIFG